MVNSNGKLGVATSSSRFKEAIKPMNKASEAILALKPVSFRYKQDIDPDGVPQFGLIAEDKSGSGRARRTGQSYDCALRIGERNVTE